MSRYLEFDQIGSTGKTDIWDVRSKSQGSVLGEIKWFGRWRQYCFYPSPNTIFNPECMTDISKMIKELMQQRGTSIKEDPISADYRQHAPDEKWPGSNHGD